MNINWNMTLSINMFWVGMALLVTYLWTSTLNIIEELPTNEMKLIVLIVFMFTTLQLLKFLGTPIVYLKNKDNTIQEKIRF